MNLENKTVFITGGTSGYGKAAAKTLTEHGASVIIAARNSPLDVPMYAFEQGKMYFTSFRVFCIQIQSVFYFICKRIPRGSVRSQQKGIIE